MPLTLRDLMGLQPPPTDPSRGTRSLHQTAAGFRELIGLNDQRVRAAAQLAQQKLEEQGRVARSNATMASANANRTAQAELERSRMAADRRKNAQALYTQFSKALLEPGGAARIQSQLPALQSAGISWHSAPAKYAEPGVDAVAGAPGDGTPAPVPLPSETMFAYTPDVGLSENWGALNLDKLSAEDRAAAERMLGALKQSTTATNSEEVANAAASAVGQEPSLGGGKLIDAYGKVANPPAGRLQSAENARRVASAAAVRQQTSLDPQGLDHAFKNTQSVVRTYANNASVKQMRTQAVQARRAVQGMSDDANSLEQNQAFLASLKAQFGAASSNKELAFMLSQGGLMTRIGNAFKRWESGTFDEKYRQDFVRAAQIMAQYYEGQLRTTAKAAGNTIRQNAVIRSQAGDAATLESLAKTAEEQVLSGGEDDSAEPDDVDKALEALPE